MSGIPYTLIRSSRKTISIQITPEGAVEVRCPKRCPKREADAFVLSKRAWIEKHLSVIAEKPVLPVLSQEEIRKLAQKAAEVFPDRVRYFAAQIGVTYDRITIRSQHTRWGSCSAKGNLNFNCLLMLCPEEVRDYVVIHELCHRRHLDHSPQFWTEVETYCPDYRSHKKWLKDNGSALISRLP